MNRRIRHLSTILIISLALIASFSSLALASQAVLAWDASTDSSVTGYNVYYGTQSGNYQAPLNAGNAASYTLTGLSASQTYYFAVTAYSSTTESAYSSELTCNFITAQTDSNGQITPSGVTSVMGGASQTYSIVPNAGYQVATLSVDGVQASPASSYTFSNVSACHTIAVTFAPVSYIISASAQTGGTISPSGATSVNAGGGQTYTINASSGYQVSGVTVDGNSIGAVSSYTFSKVAANHSINATFTQISYSISASYQGSGSISPAGTVSVASGQSATFAITANTGYQVSSLVVDGNSVAAASSYTFSNVAANHSIKASFTALQYSIAASIQGNGAISPSGTNSFSAGANVSYSMTPAAGYTLSAVVVDGNQVSGGQLQSAPASSGAAESYSFQNVNGNHNIQAVFSPASLAVADAGPDQTVQSGSTVTLDGLNSTSSTGQIVSYKWTQLSGPAVSLSNASAPQTVFSTSNIAASASLEFELTVTNSAGATSSAVCLVNVSPNGQGPAVNVGANQTVSAFSNVTLNGSSVSDSYGTIESYTWTQISGPAVSILDAQTPNASFTAPDAGTEGATLVFQLNVVDQYGLEARGLWVVNVTGDYQPPAANAGANVTTAPMSSVTLNGAASTDPAGSSDTYRWTQVSGTPVTLSDPTSANPTFTAPTGTSSQGSQLVFQLSVTDTSNQLSSTAECTVSVQITTPPPSGVSLPPVVWLPVKM